MNGVLTGRLYYNYAFKDTLQNYYEASEDIVSQMENHLHSEIESITQRVHATFYNLSILQSMRTYLVNGEGYTKILGEMANTISEMHQGDRLIHSVVIQTQDTMFEDFTRIRRHEFRFEESDMYQYFVDHPQDSIAWFAARKSPFFKGEEMVIPVVYRFHIERNDVFIIVSLQQSEIQKYLKETYDSYDDIFIADQNMENILGFDEQESTILSQFHPEDLEHKNAVCKEIKVEEKRYLATYTVMPGTNWQICALKSAESLLGNLETLRYYIIGVIIICIIVSLLLVAVLADRLTAPLNGLAASMKRVTDENLDSYFEYPYQDEVGHLASSFNYMIKRINQLIGELGASIEALKKEKEMVQQVLEQKRKAELKALQAQINPHFLYNTLNAITWQASDQGAAEVAVLSSSLGKFFRVSLSRGRERIMIREELEHVTSYLRIMKNRYKNKMNYEVEVQEDVKMLYITKLVLQPLVENSIYHGLKPKENGGTIVISICRQIREDGSSQILLKVRDDGVGIPKEELDILNQGLKTGKISRDSGYGIYNVNERIRLSYGEAYGLTLESSEGQGTTALLTVPVRTTEED